MTIRMFATSWNFFDTRKYADPICGLCLEIVKWIHFSIRRKMIKKKIPQRRNSERDIDLFFKSYLFSCFDEILDTHLYVIDFPIVYVLKFWLMLTNLSSIALAERWFHEPLEIVGCKPSTRLRT